MTPRSALDGPEPERHYVCVTKKSRGRAVSVFAVIAVLMIVGLAVRSCSASRSVGHGAIEESCFNLWRAVRIPNSAAAHQSVERAQDAASRSQDPALAADVSRLSKMYAGNANVAPLTNQAVQDALAECKKQGWKATNPCTYGVAACGSITGDTTTTS
jgi:hypothetical protein